MRQRFFLGILLCLLVLEGTSVPGFAQEMSTEEVRALNDAIQEKQRSIDQLNRQIDEYKVKIEQKQADEATLYGELDVLDNRIAKAALDMEAAEAEIDLVNTEMALIEQEIHGLEKGMQKDQDLIARMLQEIQTQDHALPLQLLFGTDTFSEFFSTLEQLESVSSDLQKAVETARASKLRLAGKQEDQQGRKEQLTQLAESLAQEQRRYETVIGAKSTLLAATQRSEAQFQALLEDVREEQAYLNQQISQLQRDIEGKLSETDELGNSSILSWPIDPTIRGISSYFHDPSYPFRHLFEHSGVDLPAPTGTPVKAAAPGYVAWARTGTLYGNYVMIIHTNGLATLYAHLSRMDVTADQFVSRGDIIGAIGNTGLSTGPHLHFETRKDGIPSNPLHYLIAY
jgi:murein DD-endopeptidase MepM/ murein hydrolase activator NlpD